MNDCQPSGPPLESPSQGPGRPRAKEPCGPITFWAPLSTQDALIRIANQRDQSLSGLLRQVAKAVVKKSKPR